MAQEREFVASRVVQPAAQLLQSGLQVAVHQRLLDPVFTAEKPGEPENRHGELTFRIRREVVKRLGAVEVLAAILEGARASDSDGYVERAARGMREVEEELQRALRKLTSADDIVRTPRVDELNEMYREAASFVEAAISKLDVISSDAVAIGPERDEHAGWIDVVLAIATAVSGLGAVLVGRQAWAAWDKAGGSLLVLLTVLLVVAGAVCGTKAARRWLGK